MSHIYYLQMSKMAKGNIEFLVLYCTVLVLILSVQISKSFDLVVNVCFKRYLDIKIGR